MSDERKTIQYQTTVASRFVSDDAQTAGCHHNNHQPSFCKITSGEKQQQQQANNNNTVTRQQKVFQ